VKSSKRSGLRTIAEVVLIILAALSVATVASVWRRQLAGGPDLKPIDFANFYTLGYAVAHQAERAALVDEDAWRSLIARIAPDRDQYPRVYGPQTALWFAPWSLLPLPVAYVGWNGVSLVAFGLTTAWLVVRFRPDLRRHHFLIVLGTMAYPALAQLLLNGHAGVIAVVSGAITAGGLAGRSPIVTGAGLGLLSFKPTLFLPMVAVALLGGEVAACLIAGAVAGALLLITVPILGFAPVEAYITALTSLSQSPDDVAKPAIMSSLRTLAYQLLPAGMAGFVYVATALATVLVAAWAWRRTTDPLERVAIASLATVLATPHFYNYDLVITLPALLVSAAYAVGRRPGWLAVAAAAAAAYVAPIVPLVSLNPPVSLAAVANLAWFVVLVRVRRSDGGASASPSLAVQ
jgi:hypothetical protein